MADDKSKRKLLKEVIQNEVAPLLIGLRNEIKSNSELLKVLSDIKTVLEIPAEKPEPINLLPLIEKIDDIVKHNQSNIAEITKELNKQCTITLKLK